MVPVAVAFCPKPSTTRIVTVAVITAVGVPVIAPVAAAMLNPAGSVPAETV